MHGRCGYIHCGPGHAVGGATGHTGDLLPLQPLHQRGLPVDSGGPVPLLSVVIIAPSIDLPTEDTHLTQAQAALLMH